jgi:hypothetical protein
VHEHEDGELIYKGKLLIFKNFFNAKLSEGNKKEKKEL